MFDFGRVDNDYFIAMDYVRGADLASLFAAERAAGRQLAAPLLAHVGVEICRALAYVHARGFVHRDVTPRNVLVSVDGEVKLSDFGLALSLESPLASGRPGTPSYMAPEQARGERVDARADIYSLGLILAEGLLGRGPRANRDPQDGVDATLVADLAKHATLSPILARAIDAVARRALRGRRGDAHGARAGDRAHGRRARGAGAGARRQGPPRSRPATTSRRPRRRAPPRCPTAADDAGPTRESYFRDDQSQHFVESMLEAVPPTAPPRARAAGWIAALAAGAAIVAAGAFALRGQRRRRGGAIACRRAARRRARARPRRGSARPQPAPEPAATEREAPAPTPRLRPLLLPRARRVPRAASRARPPRRPWRRGTSGSCARRGVFRSSTASPRGTAGAASWSPSRPAGIASRRDASTIGCSVSSTSRRDRKDRRSSISTKRPADEARRCAIFVQCATVVHPTSGSTEVEQRTCNDCANSS